MLRNVGVLVFFVWADRVKRLHSEDTDDCAKNVRLLQIKIDKVRGLLLDVRDCPFDVNWL